MIHHQQEGAKIEDILLGLIFAMVRNYKSSVVKKRKIPTPVLLAGGAMRINSVAKAIKEIFKLSDDEVILPSNPEYAGAWGSARIGKKEIRSTTIDHLTTLVQ